MLPSGKGYALDISSLMRICSGHILFEEDMLSQEGDMLPSGKGYALDISSLMRICSGISSLKRICSVKRGYAPQWQRICTGHILFDEDMLRTVRGDKGYALYSGHILFEEDMLSQEGICSAVAKDMHWTYPL
jgi:hypothetical protein